jgi:hypothetical protein
MGLILSRQIAEAHGGVLQLANRSDRTGCEVVLALPITYETGRAGSLPTAILLWHRQSSRWSSLFRSHSISAICTPSPLPVSFQIGVYLRDVIPGHPRLA